MQNGNAEALHEWWDRPPITEPKCPGASLAEQVLRASADLALKGTIDDKLGETKDRWPWIGLLASSRLLFRFAVQLDVPINVIRTYLAECSEVPCRATIAKWSHTDLGQKLRKFPWQSGVLRRMTVWSNNADPNDERFETQIHNNPQWCGKVDGKEEGPLEKTWLALRCLPQFEESMVRNPKSRLPLAMVWLAAFSPESIYPVYDVNPGSYVMHGIPRSILYVADSSAELESLARASQIQETVDTAIQEFCTFLSMADGLARQIDPRDNPITAFGHAPTPERLQSALAFLSNLRSGVSQFLLDYEESGVTLEFIRRVSYSRSALYALAKKPSLMNDGRPIHEFRNGKHYWSRAWIQERSRTEPGATP